jgi:hypothetical protein
MILEEWKRRLEIEEGDTEILAPLLMDAEIRNDNNKLCLPEP